MSPRGTIQHASDGSLREPLDEAVLKNPTLEIVEALTPGQVLLARSVRLRPHLITEKSHVDDALAVFDAVLGELA